MEVNNRMNERIKELRKLSGMTQTEFGAKIGVKGNTVTNYELGLRNPSDAVIFSICREFNINENWLRTGEGEMRVKLSRNAEITMWSSKITRSDYDIPFAQEFVHMLTKLDVEDWKTLEKMTKLLYKGKDQD